MYSRKCSYLFGLVLLLCGITMYSGIQYKTKLLFLRIILLFLLEAFFIATVYYMWKKTKVALNLFFYSKTHTSNILRKICVFSALAVVVFSNCSIFLFNIFFTCSIPLLARVWFSCLGFYFQLVIYYLILDSIVYLVILLVTRFKRSIDLKTTYAKASSISLCVCILLSFILSVYGCIKASEPPVLNTVSVKLKNFPKSMNDFKILLMSDIHFGITVTKDHLDRMVPLINQVDYDLLAVVGDLTDLPESHAKHMAVAFKRMKPRYGKYFVTGNHEYYTGDVDKWLGHLTRNLDFKVLRNEHLKIGNASNFFYLAGVDDAEAEMLRIEGHGMNFNQALIDCEQNHSIILLAHQPKAAKKAIDAYENIELVLSGHTHGGQLLPMSIVVYLTNPFFAGLYSYKKSQVFVSQGAVYWGVPMRMFSQSEINLVHIFRDE